MPAIFWRKKREEVDLNERGKWGGRGRLEGREDADGIYCMRCMREENTKKKK